MSEIERAKVVEPSSEDWCSAELKASTSESLSSPVEFANAIESHKKTLQGLANLSAVFVEAARSYKQPKVKLSKVDVFSCEDAEQLAHSLFDREQQLLKQIRSNSLYFSSDFSKKLESIDGSSPEGIQERIQFFESSLAKAKALSAASVELFEVGHKLDDLFEFYKVRGLADFTLYLFDDVFSKSSKWSSTTKKFDSYEEVEDEIEKLTHERRNLEDRFLSGLRFGFQIRSLDKAIEKLIGLSKFRYGTGLLPEGMRRSVLESEREAACSPHFVASILDTVGSNIKAQLWSSKNSIKDSFAALSHNPLPPKALEAFYSFFMEHKFPNLWAKEVRDMARAEQTFQKASTLMWQSLRERDDYPFGSEVLQRLANYEIEDFSENEHQALINIVNAWRLQLIKKLPELIVAIYVANSEQELKEVFSLQERIGADLAYAANSVWPRFSDSFSFSIFDQEQYDKDLSTHLDQNKKCLVNARDELWDIVLGSGGLSNDLTEVARRVIASNALDIVLTTRERTDERVRAGRQLLAFKDTALVPLIILNCFREPGYSGEYPFIGSLMIDEKPLLQQYLDSLPESTVQEVLDKNIPGINRFFELYRAQQDPLSGTVEEHEKQLKAIQLELQKLCCHYIRVGTSEERLFAVSGLRSQRIELQPTTLACLESTLRNLYVIAPELDSMGETIIEEVELALLSDSSKENGDSAAAIILLTVIGDPSTPDKYKEPALVIDLFESFLGQSNPEARHIAILAELLEEEPSAVTQALRFINSLRGMRPIGQQKRSASDISTFEQELDLSKLSGANDAIRVLKSLGYTYEKSHLFVLPTLIKESERISEMVQDIRTFCPDYDYSPTRNYFTDTQEDAHDSDIVYELNPYYRLLTTDKPSLVLQKALRETGSLSDDMWTGLNTMVQYSDYRGVIPDSARNVVENLVKDSVVPETEELTLTGQFLALRQSAGLYHSLRFPQEAEVLIREATLVSEGDPELFRDIIILTMDLSQSFRTTTTEGNTSFQKPLPQACRIIKHCRVIQLYDKYGKETQAGHQVVPALKQILAMTTHQKFHATKVSDLIDSLLESESEHIRAVLGGLSFFNEETDADSFVSLFQEFLKFSQTIGPAAEITLTKGLSALLDAGWVNTLDDVSTLLSVCETMHKQSVANPEAWEVLRLFLDPQHSRFEALELSNNGPQELEVFRDFFREYGFFHVRSLFTLYRGLSLDEVQDTELKSVGINSRGKAGLNQLALKVKAFTLELIGNEGSVHLDSPLAHDVLVSVSRFFDSEWTRNDPTIYPILEDFNEALERGDIAKLRPELKRRSLSVKKLDAMAVSEFRFAPHCIEKLNSLMEDIQQVAHLQNQQLVDEVKISYTQSLQAKVRQYESPLSTQEQNEDKEGKRAAGRHRAAKRLHEIVTQTEGVGTKKELLALLLSNHKLDKKLAESQIRKLVIHSAIRFIGSADEVVQLAETGQTDRHTLHCILGFFDNAVHEHSIPALDLPKKQEELVRGICGTKALREELVRMKNLPTAGIEQFAVVPTRGLLGELSGYLCDACWTSESDIMRRYPNISVDLFVRNPDTNAASISGATLLIETESTKGEKVLVIRGFNPRQNIITTLDATDFFEQYLDQLESVARAMGIQKIVIPRGQSGGAQTNRPDINVHISSAYKEADAIVLRDDDPHLYFNGYSIANSCTIVREL